MQIIKPYAEIISATENIELIIEQAIRVCYKSEDRICEGSANKIIKDIMDKHHESTIEHAMITVRVINDRGVSHEEVRHRLSSFSQESTRYCVAGDMKLNTSNPHQNLTIADLYNNRINSINGAWKRIKLKQLNELTGQLGYSTINEIFYTGMKPTIKIKTNLGYEIICTEDHEILTSQGYVKGSNLNTVGDIAVNGSTLLYRNAHWLFHQYNTLYKTAVQIANDFNFNVSTIKKWINIFNLPRKPLSYWNKGREPWNKGLTEDEDPRVKIQANALREYYWDLGRVNIDKPNRIMKLGKSNYGSLVEECCEICNSEANLQVHHIDENRENNSIVNLITLCPSCRQGLHSRNLEVVYYDKITSITDNGIVPVYDISMDSQFKNFIANGVVVHNCQYSKDKFGNEITVIDIKSGFPDMSEECYLEWLEAMNDSERHYNRMIELGAKAQLARSVLPNSLKTELVWSANPREWRLIFKLRTSAAAHPQIAEVLVPLLGEFKKRWPVLFSDIEPAKCWDRYIAEDISKPIS